MNLSVFVPSVLKVWFSVYTTQSNSGHNTESTHFKTPSLHLMSSLSKLNAKKNAARKTEKPSQPKSQIQSGKPTIDACPDFLRNVTKLTNDRPHASKTHSGWCESLMAALLGEKDFAEDASVFTSTKWPKIPKPVLGQTCTLR